MLQFDMIGGTSTLRYRRILGMSEGKECVRAGLIPSFLFPTAPDAAMLHRRATTSRATDQSWSSKRLGMYIVWEKMSFPPPPAFLQLQP
jgi:hypothetical protein